MKQKGFTLIELMTALIIISILTFSGYSSYRFLITQAKASRDKARLLTMIQMTRQHSITFSSTTVLCPSDNKEDCTRDWSLPIMQFLDSNKNKKRDPNEIIVGQFQPFNKESVTIKYPKTQIRFDAQGKANFFNGTLSYCSGESIEGIVISRIGRIRFAQDLDGDNIPDVNSNTPVSC